MTKQHHVNAWRANTKQKLVHALGGRCQMCGYNKTHYSLDFHHLDSSTKESTISRMMVRPVAWKKIVQEASKCVLLCSNCHRELHAGISILPEAVQAFDERLIPTELLKLPATSTCPTCGLVKLNHNKYCSRSCSTKANKGSSFDITKFDIVHMVEIEKIPYVRIAKQVGCSDVTVRKHYLKLKKML